MILWNFLILYLQKSFLSAFVLMVPKNVFDTFFSRWCTSRSLTSAYFKVGRWTHSSRQNSGWKFGQSIPYTLPWWARWVVDRMLPQQHRILTLDLLERLVHKLHLCAGKRTQAAGEFSEVKSSDLTFLVAHLYSPRFFICISLALVLTTPCLYWQRYNCWYRSVWSPWPRVSQTPQHISTWPKNLCFWWGACTDDCCSFCQGVCISV